MSGAEVVTEHRSLHEDVDQEPPLNVGWYWKTIPQSTFRGVRSSASVTGERSAIPGPSERDADDDDDCGDALEVRGDLHSAVSSRAGR